MKNYTIVKVGEHFLIFNLGTMFCCASQSAVLTMVEF